MLSENMVPWYIKYFRIKEFKKNDRGRKVIKLSCETALTWVERHILHSGHRGTIEESKETVLAKFPAYFSNLIL